MKRAAPSEWHQAIRACGSFVAWAGLFSAGVNLLYLAPSLFMMQVYDRVLPTGGLATLGFTALVLAAALLTLSLLDAVRSRLMTRMSLRLDRIIAPSLLERTLRGGMDKARAQIMREFDTFRQIVAGPATNAVFDAPWAPIYIAVCFLIHPALGVLTAAGCALLLIVALLNERAMRRALNEGAELSPRLYAGQEADWAAAETVRAMGMRGVLIERQLARRSAFNATQSAAAFSGTYYSAASRFLRMALQSGALGLGAFLAVERQISPGALIAASILAARALSPMEQIVGAWRQIAQARTAYNAVETVFAETAGEPQRTALPAPRGALRFESAAIRGAAGEKPILSDVSFASAPGEILGVIGPSGAGKSTLARLAVGAIAPDLGAVRLDGASLRDWDSDALGKHIGYLPQDVQLLGGTVAENIRRFAPAAESTVDEKTVAAARAAGAHDMILQLPNGYDTPIGPGGRGLSFGQMQRIALARALYGQPALLVLDEPNAHLDAAGEAALIQAVKEAKDRGASVVLIAHRAGVLAAADNLLVLNNGRVENFGKAQDVARKLAESASGAKTTFLPQRGAAP